MSCERVCLGSIGWPLSVPKDLETNAWYQTLSDREKEVARTDDMDGLFVEC